MGIYTEKYGYFSDVTLISAEEFASRDLRYMCSTKDGYNFYEDRYTGEIFAITDGEMRKYN